MNMPLVLLMKNEQETPAEQIHFDGVPISQIHENWGIKKMFKERSKVRFLEVRKKKILKSICFTDKKKLDPKT